MNRTPATTLARATAVLLGACLAAGTLPATAEAAPAPRPAPKPAAKPVATLRASGGFTAGRALAVSGTCAKATSTSAVVTGPRGMRTTLTPAKKGATLTGTIAVPKGLDAGWIRLRSYCKDGSTASVVVRRAKASTPTPKPAPKPAPVKVWAEGRMRPGATLNVYAQAGLDRKGKPVTTATVVGPRGMKTTLTPMADRPWLGGTITVPKNLKGSWIRLTMTTAAGAQATTIVRS